jgi:AcrR family transcriptional regulator
VSDDNRRPRLSKAETQEKLIASAIELMRGNPIGKVSALKICEHAGLDKMAVRYCFGSYVGLLVATALELGRSVSAHVRDGLFDSSAYVDENAVLFGKMLAYLFTSFGDELPKVTLDQLPNFVLIETQIAETYGLRPELARALAKRAAHIAVATVAIERFIPLTEREHQILHRAQRFFYEEVAKVQDQVLE